MKPVWMLNDISRYFLLEKWMHKKSEWILDKNYTTLKLIKFIQISAGYVFMDTESFLVAQISSEQE